MIKSNELRLGNLSKNGIVNSLHVNSIQIIDKFGNLYYNFEPIPLTEEWLKRFGFERLVGWLDVWSKDGFDRFELTEIHDEYFFNDTKIEFVHQLQNAFFCIEQTELTPSDGGKIE